MAASLGPRLLLEAPGSRRSRGVAAGATEPVSAMLFYEPLFLFLFGPAVYFAYFFFGPARGPRALILLVASVAFYGWSEPHFILTVFAAIASDLLVARGIVSAPAGAPRRSLWLALGVGVNLAILVYFKYAGFIVANLDVALARLGLPPVAAPQVALPIGVSFIVFEKITYLVDVYRGVAVPARGPLLYSLYVFFFPKLLAGPIIKYHDIERQFDECPHADIDDFVAGFSRFMLGVAKKLLIADTMASGADLVFTRDPTTLGFTEAWAGAIFFTFQIYFDFSGYSDMAIGLARMFGFRLLENFDMPYIAESMSDFWRRWHISLTSWIREYLYFPLGGNRGGAARTYFNLWVCFLASGVWHGAAWPYILWGVYNGFFLILDRLFLVVALRRLPGWLANLITLALIIVGWTIFRSTSFEQMRVMLALMAQPFRAASTPVAIPPEIILVATIAALICVAQRIGARRPGFDWAACAARYPLASNSLLALLFVAAVAKGLADPFKPFIYFRF